VTYVGLENITQNTGEITGSVVTSDPTEIKSLKNIFKPGNILYGKLRPNLNKVWLADRNGICSTDIFVIEAIEGKADPALYAYLFRTKRFNVDVLNQIKGAQLPRVGWPSFAELQIPLPPLEVQQEIVAEIDGYQRVIDGARAVLDNYKPHVSIDPDWPIVELGDVITLQRGYDLPKQEWRDGSFPIVGSNGIIGFHAEWKEIGPGVVTGRSGTIGKVHYIDFEHYWPHNTSLFVKDYKENDPKFVKVLLESIDLKALGERTAAVPSLDRKNAHRVLVSIPPIVVQQAIVAELEAEQALVAANRELIARMERKIQAVLDRVWGEGTS
jgi:type I restriction enzyme M protein